MLATFAFDVCHDVYRAAREAIDSKIATLNAENSGKYQWRPDRLPRLAEYVCDFARAGERALGEGGRGNPAGGRAGICPSGFAPVLGENRQAGLGNSRAGGRDLARSRGNRQAEACPTAGAARSSPGGHRAGPSCTCGGFRASPSCTCGALRASRTAMFRVYYLGGAEYAAARRHLGISELTWADWADEIRRIVGGELARAGLFPPSKYFREESARAS